MIAEQELVPVARDDWTGVSAKEEALLLADALADGAPVNNRSVTFTVAGHLDPARLDLALSVVLRRHDALRTVYQAGEAYQSTVKRVVEPDAFVFQLTRTVSAGPPGESDLTPLLSAPFEASGAPMLRAALFEGPDTEVFCLVAHHLIMDGPAVSGFVAELAAAYDGAVLEPVPAHAEALPRSSSLAHWREALAGAREDDAELLCALPETGRWRPDAAHATRTLSAPAAAAVHQLAAALDVPVAAILLAGYHLVLEAHGASPDLIIGTPVDTRPAHGASVIGYHVNHVPLRLALDPAEPVGDLIARAARTLRDAGEHADVPVDAHAELLPRPRSGRPRIAPFRYVFQTPAADDRVPFPIGGRTATPLVPATGFSKFDLDLSGTVSGGGTVRIDLWHRTDLLDPAGAALLLARYEAVLAALAENPAVPTGDVPGWSTLDHEVITAANDTAGPVHPASVLAAVRAQVAATPDAPAVVQDGREVGYRQLWQQAHAVAGLLSTYGVSPGDVVATALPRGADLVASVLGTWLAGAAYLPIDAAHPQERIRYQLADSGARVLVAEAGLAHVVDGDRVLLTPPTTDGSPVEELPVTADPDACAYLIYTSGSTGKPKGTRVGHRALANLIAHFAEELAARPGDTMLWLTTFAFDISGLELFVPLVTGGRLAPAPDAARSDGRVLRELVERYDARFVQATPTTWRLVLDRVESGLRGRTVLAGGEIVPSWLAERLVAAGAEFHHVYGPTETTIWSTSAVVTDASRPRLDVGRPIRNTQVFVLDQQGRELPIGVRGELCIAGLGVAIGYHERPDLNAQRFGEHSVYGRFYRTGDLARWRADGTLDLFGRGDRQVKLRGNRIELGEIEATLLACPGVDAAAVVMIGDPSADAVLVGCLEPAGETLDLDGVWRHARAHLSSSMLPGDLLVIDALPINGSGKVDYPALTREIGERREQERREQERREQERREQERREQDGPATDDDLADRLVVLWRTILQRPELTPDSHFFESGGNSMLAAWAMQELQNLSGVSLGLAEIFERPTANLLAARVRELTA